MRLSSPLALVFCVSGCISSGGPALISVTAWERGDAIDSAETRRLERLELPRNAQLTFRAIEATVFDREVEALRLFCRVHTVDGGMVTWELEPGAAATEPIRAQWLKRLDVMVGTRAASASARVSGPPALAEVPSTGTLGLGEWVRLSLAVEEVGGSVELATQLPIYPGAEAEPGRSRRFLVIEGAAHGGREAQSPVVSALIELGIEIVDRDHRPKQKHWQAPERHDPVREPAPRDLAASR